MSESEKGGEGYHYVNARNDFIRLKSRKWTLHKNWGLNLCSIISREIKENGMIKK